MTDGEALKPKYFAYIRKSTDTKEKQVMSVESQKIEITRLFGDAFEIEFIEEKQSAFIPNNRPLFDSMLERLIAGEIHGLLGWHPDRLSRNEIDAARITYALRMGKIGDLQFCSYQFNNSPEGIMHLQSALSHSQYESAKKAVDVRREMTHKCERGWFPETAPNGYKNSLDDAYDEPIIVIDEVRAPLIRRAIDLVLSRELTPNQALARLNGAWGYKSLKTGKKGNRPLATATWYKMLSNKFYYGMFDWAGKEYQGKHEPLITAEEFDHLQIILGRKGKPRSKRHDFAFAGTMRCNTCGYSIIFEKKSKFVKSFGGIKTYTLAHCSHQNPHVACVDRVNSNELKLIEQMKREIAPFTIHPLLLNWAIEILNDNEPAKIKDDAATKETATRSLEKLREGVRNLVRMRSLNQIDDALFEESKAEFELEIGLLESESMKYQEDSEEKWLELTRKTFEFATHAFAKLDSGTNFEKRQVLLGLSENPCLDFGKLMAEPYEWFLPIKNWLAEKRDDIRRLEPVFNSFQSNKKGELETLFLSWYPVIDEVRTVFRKLNRTDISIPNLNFDEGSPTSPGQTISQKSQ